MDVQFDIIPRFLYSSPSFPLAVSYYFFIIFLPSFIFFSLSLLLCFSPSFIVIYSSPFVSLYASNASTIVTKRLTPVCHAPASAAWFTKMSLSAAAAAA